MTKSALLPLLASMALALLLASGVALAVPPGVFDALRRTEGKAVCTALVDR